MEPLLQLLSNIKLDASTHPQHYLIHKYWGRKPHNIISSYIKIFTDKGDKVLDPFIGSGGVVIESNKIGRKSKSFRNNKIVFKQNHFIPKYK